MRLMDEVSAFTKGVGQKAKGNYDIVTMNNRISSLQKEIRGVYTKLGEAYYSLHKEEAEEALRDYTFQIQQLESQVAKVQQQVDATKELTAAVSLKAAPDESVMGDRGHGFCANCGAPLPEDSMFCVKCGTKVEQVDVKEPENN